jgi:YihY family inner membrane protein
MSTASLVPETWHLTGDDARATLKHVGPSRLLADSFRRLRVADGFSHGRSLAFMTSLVLVQGVIAFVGLASALGGTRVSEVIVNAIRGTAPGPAGDVLTVAVQQAQGAGLSRRYLGLILGTVGMLISATTAMGQIERALNRLYGVEQDRPTREKYGLAFLLAVTSGALAAAAFIAMAQGRAIGDSLHNHVLTTAWGWGRWPLAVILITAAVTLLFRWCPRRHQPGLSWLAYGSTMSVLGWLIVTLSLAALFNWSSSFGDTYGPLAGLLGLQLWALLSAIAILYGAAVAAQLEAVRAGSSAPQDTEKVAESEPDADDSAAAVQPVGVGD